MSKVHPPTASFTKVKITAPTANTLTSERNTPEQGATPLVGTGELVLLRRSAAENLLSNLDGLAKDYRMAAKRHAEKGASAMAYSKVTIAETLEILRDDFRRQLELTNERQPQENNPVSQPGEHHSRKESQ